MSVPPNTSKLDSFKTQQPKCLFEGKPFYFFHRLIELTFFYSRLFSILNNFYKNVDLSYGSKFC